MRSLSSRRWLILGVLGTGTAALYAGACATKDVDPPGLDSGIGIADASSEGSTTGDAQAETGADSGNDTGTSLPDGSVPDADASVTGDAAPDAAADATIDASPDAAADAAPDASVPNVEVGSRLFATVPRGVAIRGNEIAVVGTFTGVVDFGGGALTSAGSNDIFVAKYSLAGTHLWSKRFGGVQDDGATAVAFDGATGDVVVTGYVGPSGVDLGAGSKAGIAPDPFLLKLTNANGTHVWSRRFITTGSGYGHGVAVDANGNVGIAADFIQSINNGDAVVNGAGGSDAFFGKYAGGDGSPMWARTHGGTGGDRVDGIAFDGAGDLIVGGYIQSSADFGGGVLVAINFTAVAAKYAGATGNFVWARAFGVGAGVGVTSVSTDGANNVILGGSFPSTIDFGGGVLTAAGQSDGFVASLTSAGAHQWSKRVGSTTSDGINGVAATAAGQVTFGGFFSGTVDLGAGAVASQGGNDGFLASTNSNGDYLWHHVVGTAAQEQVRAVATTSTHVALVGEAGSGGFFRVLTR